MTGWFDGFRDASGPESETNQDMWKNITTFIAKNEPWKSDVKNDEEFKKLLQKLTSGWTAWKKSGDGGGDDGDKDSSRSTGNWSAK